MRREPLCRTPIFGTVRPQSMMCGLLFRAAKVGICGVEREKANSVSERIGYAGGLGGAFAGAAFCRRAGSGGFRNAGQGEARFSLRMETARLSADCVEGGQKQRRPVNLKEIFVKEAHRRKG